MELKITFHRHFKWKETIKYPEFASVRKYRWEKNKPKWRKDGLGWRKLTRIVNEEYDADVA